jgi:hypothetical protein
MWSLHVGPNFVFEFFSLNAYIFQIFSKILFQNFMPGYFFQCFLQNLSFCSYFLYKIHHMSFIFVYTDLLYLNIFI